MTAATQPEVTELPAPSTGEVHAVCCDLNRALCGSDRAGRPFLPEDAEVTCRLCAIADEEELPCGDPSCPFRDGEVS